MHKGFPDEGQSLVWLIVLLAGGARNKVVCQKVMASTPPSHTTMFPKWFGVVFCLCCEGVLLGVSVVLWLLWLIVLLSVVVTCSGVVFGVF